MANLIQVASWGPLTNSGSSIQRNYFRVPFEGAPNILATAYLDAVSLGVQDGTAGIALAAFKRYEYLDANGQVQEQELDPSEGWAFLQVDRCVSITIAFDLADAWACGGWSFYS